MTKEELEKEAEEFTDSKKSFWRQGRTCIDSVKQAYIAGAEPRERRIAELETTNKKISSECHKLVDSFEKKQNENVELIGKVAFLENGLNNAKAQIEKMKYALNKIIKTVQNDNISAYGDRLVIIYDISCEVIKEIKEK